MKHPAKPTPSHHLSQYKLELLLLLVASLLLMTGVLLYNNAQNRADNSEFFPDDNPPPQVPANMRPQLQAAKLALTNLNNQEAKSNITVVSDATAQEKLNVITQDLRTGQTKKARSDLVLFELDLATWQQQLNQQAAAQNQPKAAAAPATASAAPKPAPPPSNSLLVPILIYHHPPSDMDAQLQNLRSKRYTTIDLGQLVSALHHELTLPAKPVILTFDDGFEDQMSAVNILEKYQMKATFYIIDGGAASNWCIGAGRQYRLPSQPPGGCGDAYLSWDQVRQLDQTGLITIGSHTVNHRDLSSLSSADQWFEINEGKTELESQLGHPVADFAYPYGDFTSNTLQLVQHAGFRSAVTTLPGYYQSGQYTFHRDRSAYTLP